MIGLRREDGGLVAKLAVLILVIVLILSIGVYVYGKRQQPLALDGVHVGATGGGGTAARVVVARDARVYVATLVRNDGSLPVTLEGLAEVTTTRDQPFRAIEISLGDGKTAAPEAAAGFTPVKLDPGESVGVIMVFAVNPAFACTGFTDTPDTAGMVFPPLPLRFSSYGVDNTELVQLGKGAPAIHGLTQAQCERATAG
jgi:hypothetical protein